MLYAVRCKFGIALKLAGCALIHGWGNHRWGNPVEYPGGRLPSVAACRSCGTYRYEPEVEGRALKAWRVVVRIWVAATDPIIHRAGRLGCRVLDRHQYRACRGRSDHAPIDGRIQRVRVVDGRWVPARR